MYDDIEILRPRPYLLTFEGHNSVIALNFASDDETNSFFHTANTIAVSRRKRREGNEICAYQKLIPLYFQFKYIMVVINFGRNNINKID